MEDVHYNIHPQRLPLNGNAHSQSAMLESLRPPHHCKKKKVGATGKLNYIFCVTNGKVHFCDQKNALCQHLSAAKRHFEKKCFVPILAAFISSMALKPHQRHAKMC